MIEISNSESMNIEGKIPHQPEPVSLSTGAPLLFKHWFSSLFTKNVIQSQHELVEPVHQLRLQKWFLSAIKSSTLSK